MPVINLEDFGNFGLIKGKKPWTLPPEAWSGAGNVRFVDGVVEKFTGHVDVYDPPTVAPLYALYWPNPAGRQWIYGGAAKLYRISGQTQTDITRTVGGDYNATVDNFWQGVVLGGVPILNNRSGLDYPQQWDGTTSKMIDLANWPANTYCKVLKMYKQFLIALDIEDGSGRKPYLVKWSDVATPGSVPTTWDPSDATKKAGEFPLVDTPGFLVDCALLGNANIIYKEDSTWAQRFVGGQSVFSFDQLTLEHEGILTARCVDNIGKGQHFVVTRGDVAVHNGQTSQSVIDPRNRKFLFDNINQTYLNRTFVRTNKKTKEVWICFVSSNAANQYPDMALVWNYKNNTWGVRDLPLVSWIESGIIDATSTSYIIDDVPGIIDVDNADALIDYEESGAVPGEDDFLMASYGNTKFYEADNTNQFSGVDFNSYVERLALTVVGQDRMGQPIADLESRKLLKAVYPKMESNGPVNFYLGGQDSLNGPVQWTGPYSFDPNTQSRIDCRVNRKLLAYRIESSSNIHWKLTGIGLDINVVSKARLG